MPIVLHHIRVQRCFVSIKIILFKSKYGDVWTIKSNSNYNEDYVQIMVDGCYYTPVLTTAPTYTGSYDFNSFHLGIQVAQL